MTDKEPALLTVLIETAALRWYVAGIDLTGRPSPLLVSEPGNLSPYLGVPFDEQVNFLRHRLSGVLQRGCDRLWSRQQKPCQIVFVADGLFVEADAALTPRVAEHFVEWLTSPPVVFSGSSQPLRCAAGPSRALASSSPGKISFSGSHFNRRPSCAHNHQQLAERGGAVADLDVGVGLLARADAVEPVLDVPFGDPAVALPFLGQLRVRRVLDESPAGWC
jgi:hypothetical protein